VHDPVCRNLCHFCACNRVVTRSPELPARDLKFLAREIEEIRRALPGGVRAGRGCVGFEAAPEKGIRP